MGPASSATRSLGLRIGDVSDDMDEHPPPGDATVKELYACAFRCAHPECSRPLYRLNNNTGDRILNSRVAHIHARRKGGPRWKSMTSAENRSVSNLVLLCIEHSYEVDEFHDRFPADTLRDWKRAQLAEYDQIQRSWPLNDAEAAEVAAVSFDERRVGMARAGAASVLAVARSAALLMAAARRGRRGPAVEAAAWQATRERVRSSMVAWDSRTGERIYAEPSPVESDTHRQSLQAALAQAQSDLAPLADAVHAEVSAVAAADPSLRPWCAWIDAAVQRVVSGVGRWPGQPPFDDDDALEAALENAQRGVNALSAQWRGEAAENPPEPPPEPVPAVEDEGARLLREHSELLDLARPFARVEHRPFDLGLYERVIANLTLAAHIPPIVTYLSVELNATASLAAAVARNADDATYRQLIANAAGQQPLAASAALLVALANVAERAGRKDLQHEALVAATASLQAVSWRDRTIWRDNLLYMRTLLSTAAHLCGTAHVAMAVKEALVHDPSLLDVILEGCAQWNEQRDVRDMGRVLSIGLSYTELPEWFPAAIVAEEIKRQMPSIHAEANLGDRGTTDELARLAASVLHLTEGSCHPNS